jgi:phosphatidylinositol alpha 1,6-mannosyltransferase
MRILMAARTADPTAGGSAQFTARLAAGLAGAGHEVVTVASSAPGRVASDAHPGDRVEPIAAVPLWPFTMKERIPLWPRRRVAWLMERCQPDVVHLQDRFRIARATLDAARQHGLEGVVGAQVRAH